MPREEVEVKLRAYLEREWRKIVGFHRWQAREEDEEERPGCVKFNPYEERIGFQYVTREQSRALATSARAGRALARRFAKDRSAQEGVVFFYPFIGGIGAGCIASEATLDVGEQRVTLPAEGDA